MLLSSPAFLMQNLGDEVFKLRHQKPEIDEKRRKRWDEQRQRDQKLFERLQNRKDQTLNNVQAVATPRTITTDNESKGVFLKIGCFCETACQFLESAGEVRNGCPLC